MSSGDTNRKTCSLPPGRSWLLPLLLALLGCASPENKAGPLFDAYRAAVEAKDIGALSKVFDANQLRFNLTSDRVDFGWSRCVQFSEILSSVVGQPIRKVSDRHGIVYLGWSKGETLTHRCLRGVVAGEAPVVSKMTSVMLQRFPGFSSTVSPSSREWRVAFALVPSYVCFYTYPDGEKSQARIQKGLARYQDADLLQAFLYGDSDKVAAIQEDLGR